MTKWMTSVALAAVLATGAAAKDITDFADIFAEGDATLTLRYRLETVSQDGIDRNATASTLLTKLGYKTATYKGFTGVMELTHTETVGAENFNSTVNGNTQFPVVADPKATEWNLGYVQYKNDLLTLRAGRQGINYGRQRFIGTVAFRQNDQTYDAVSLSATPGKDLTANYAYVWNVNRIFGPEHPLGDLASNSHFLNVTYSGLGFGKLTGYAYLLDFNDSAVAGLSSATYGARFEGKQKVSDGVGVGYRLEYATQSDYKDSPRDYKADYFNADLTVSGSGFTVGAGYELLGSDNGFGFATPLATLHKFNGWADKFLTTPGAGLQDMYGSVAYKVPGQSVLGGTLFKLVYHDFQSDVGDSDYGTEWGFLISKKIYKSVTVSLKTAFYSADEFATDSERVWVTVGAKF